MFNLKFHELKMAYSFNLRAWNSGQLLVQYHKYDIFISSFTDTLKFFLIQYPSYSIKWLLV